LSGGRFAPVGMKAVYASFEEETAMGEVNVRKSALGGRSQISVGDYPRLTYSSQIRHAGALISLSGGRISCPDVNRAGSYLAGTLPVAAGREAFRL
jgi:hypothetical protein